MKCTATQNLSFYLEWSHVLSCSGSPRYFPLMKIRPDQFNLNPQKWIWYLYTFESSAVKFSHCPRRCHGGAALIKALASCASAFPCSCASVFALGARLRFGALNVFHPLASSTMDHMPASAGPCSVWGQEGKLEVTV